MGRLQAEWAPLSHSLSCFTGEMAMGWPLSSFPAQPDFSICLDVPVKAHVAVALTSTSSETLGKARVGPQRAVQLCVCAPHLPC